MNRIGVRLFLVVAVAILGITVAYDYLRLQREQQRVLSQMEREAGLVARAVEGSLQFWMRTGSRTELERLLRDIREAKDATCVGIYDLAGRLDIVSRTEGGPDDNTDGCPANLDAGTDVETILSRWSPLGTFRILMPLTQEGLRTGTLKLVFPGTVITDPIRRQRYILLIERGLVLAAMGVALWAAIAVLVGRPIRRLLGGVEQVARGELRTRTDVKTRTEVGDLARAFNRMAQSLREAQERRLTLERQVRHADKLAATGQLASQMAHEVGTPLNVISGRARILARDLPPGDPRREGLEIIRTQVERISRVIERLLKVARPPRMQKERVRLEPIAREVAAFVGPELQKQRVRLDLALGDDLPPVTGDPDGLFQVLLNVIMNANAAAPPGGRIELSAAGEEGGPREGREGDPRGPGVEIRVSDDGHGIDPELLPRVFEPFVSSKPGEGTGLGLSICRDIVREHGGRIAVESLPGQGTTVRIWLPAAPEEQVDGRPAHSHR